MVCYESDWDGIQGGVSLPPILSEPPPPYSPPKETFSVLPEPFLCSPLSLKRNNQTSFEVIRNRRICEPKMKGNLKLALNHSPSSAFTPLVSKSGNIDSFPFSNYPPPYSEHCSLPPYPSVPSRDSDVLPCQSMRNHCLPKTKSHNLVNNTGVPLIPFHTTGPLRKIGKSLQLSKNSGSRSFNTTVHRHPTQFTGFHKNARKDRNTEIKPRLAYVGIASHLASKKHTGKRTSEKSFEKISVKNYNSKYCEKGKRDVQFSTTEMCKKHFKHHSLSPDCKSVCAIKDSSSSKSWENIPNTIKKPPRTSCIIQGHPLLLNARARPALACFVSSKEEDSLLNHRENSTHSNFNSCQDEGQLYIPASPGSRAGLRSYKSLDELSELLEEESFSLKYGSRSLDDLSEPFYENLSFSKSQCSADCRFLDNGEESLTSRIAPALPPRSKPANKCSSPDPSTLSKISGDCSTPDPSTDIGVQLKRLKEIAKVLGIDIQNGDFLSQSPFSEHRMKSSLSSLDASPPNVPSRAPVIQDVSLILRNKNKKCSNGINSYSPVDKNGDSRNLYKGSKRTNGDIASKDKNRYAESPSTKSKKNPIDSKVKVYPDDSSSLPSKSPEADCVSQESGYSSVDSRSTTIAIRDYRKYLRSTQHRPKGTFPRGGYRLPCEEITFNSSHRRTPELYQRTTPEPLMFNACSYSSTFSQDVGPCGPSSLPCFSNANCKRRENVRSNTGSNKRGNFSQDSLSEFISINDTICKNEGENQDHLGIYIKSVVPGGAADMDGRLQAGDQLLSVDGKSLVGISQEEAAQYMVGTGSVVTLEVARQGALFHGLAPLLSQPSPQVPRGGNLDQYRDAMGGGVHSHPHHQSMQHYPPHSGHPSHPGYHSQMHKPPLSSSHHHHHHHHHPMVNHHYQASRIQPSKSVPALNSDANAMMTRKSESHDVINPSFSVGSSVSLSQLPPHQQPVRSRSTQNLNEGGPLALSGRHPSTPALNGEEDRHYQNVSFHQGHQDPRMGSQRGGRPPIFDHQRPASQQAMMRPGDPRLTLPLGEDPRKRFSGASTTSPVGSPGFTAGIHRPPPPFARGNPRYTSSHGVVPPHLPSPHGYLPHSPAGSPMSHVPPMVSPHYPSPSSHSAPLVASGPLKHPPPTAPKPQRNSGSNFPSEAVSSPHSEHPHGRMIPSAILRPTSLDESFRDSPPPPPPPTSTHPLLQGGLKGGPQSGTPTKPGFLKSPWQRDEKEKYQIRKREAARRWRDEQISALESLSSRSVQEEEMLKTLRLEREFQKRAEAQSKEDDDEEEEGVDDAEEEEGGEGEAEENEQQPREPGNRKSWSSGNVPMGGVSSLAKSEREELSVIGGGVSRLVKDDFRSKSSNAHHQLTKSSVVSNGGISTPEVGNKVEEIRRKQLELEVAQRTEERLLQRVHQRQEEQQHLSQVIMGGVEDTHHRVSSSHQRHQASQRLDTLVGSSVPPQRIVNGGNIGPNRIYPPGIGGSSSPLPPERGSSFAVMNQHVSPDPSSTVKRVQFSPHSPSDESSKITYDDNANHQKASSFSSPTPHHDPDDFINEAETLMNSSVANKPTGGTPGVIGAQEVYRDPRQRRLHEQAQRAAAGQARPGPEKLTFREKMKMFAREAEQGGE